MKHFSAEEKQNSGGNIICQTLCWGRNIHNPAGKQTLTTMLGMAILFQTRLLGRE
jgi:hypothetical protein